MWPKVHNDGCPHVALLWVSGGGTRWMRHQSKHSLMDVGPVWAQDEDGQDGCPLIGWLMAMPKSTISSCQRQKTNKANGWQAYIVWWARVYEMYVLYRTQALFSQMSNATRMATKDKGNDDVGNIWLFVGSWLGLDVCWLPPIPPDVMETYTMQIGQTLWRSECNRFEPGL